MIHFEQSKKFPPLQRSRWPRSGPRPCSRDDHAELLKEYPESFVADDNTLPMLAFIQEFHNPHGGMNLNEWALATRANAAGSAATD